MKRRAVYVALAIDIEGEKKVLGLWIAPTEGAVSSEYLRGVAGSGHGGLFHCVRGRSEGSTRGSPLWRKDWERLAPFFDYAPAIRKVIYTTNAIESLNYSLRKIVKGRGAFPNDDAVRKLLYLGLVEEMEATHTRLEGRTQPVRHTLRGQSAH